MGRQSWRLLALCAAVNAATPPNILHIVVDDLGYDDLGYKNGVVETPTLDSMALGGVRLSDYYTFTVCAPSRASIMTGRYPWGIGYYWVGGDAEGVDLKYKMVPTLLKQGGYDTVAVGKWHCGGEIAALTPTFRGFDEFFGYYHAATSSYWYHGGEGGGCDTGPNGAHVQDHTLNIGKNFSGMTGDNGTYSTHSFSDYAVQRIKKHDSSKPLYLYLAYQATHGAAGSGIQAPLGTVNRYGMIKDDTQKVQAAATTELDWGVGNVTQALKDAGMWDNTVVVVVTDNGGPLTHTNNHPLRGGKHTYWEGGVRGEAFVYSELLPKSVRGTMWSGMAHTSDWYPTFVEGVAGLTIPEDTGPRPLDGFNLWPALKSGGASPRNEVITQVQNSYSVGHGLAGSVIRQGDFKLIISDPGDDSLIPYPPAASAPVPFGHSGGRVEPGTDHCTSGKGLEAKLLDSKKCADAPCLFNVKTDVSESVNLAGKSEYAATLKKLTDRVNEAAKTGPPFAETFSNKKDQNAAKQKQCAIAKVTGFVQPADCNCADLPPPGPSPPPGPPAPPAPVPKACEAACEKDCPRKKYKSYDDCLKCTRNSKEVVGAPCKPKERQAYCNKQVELLDLVV